MTDGRTDSDGAVAREALGGKSLANSLEIRLMLSRSRDLCVCVPKGTEGLYKLVFFGCVSFLFSNVGILSEE